MCSEIAPDKDRTLVAIYRDGKWRILPHSLIRVGDHIIYLDTAQSWMVASVEDYDGFNKKIKMTRTETIKLT